MSLAGHTMPHAGHTMQTGSAPNSHRRTGKTGALAMASAGAAPPMKAGPGCGRGSRGEDHKDQNTEGCSCPTFAQRSRSAAHTCLMPHFHQSTPAPPHHRRVSSLRHHPLRALERRSHRSSEAGPLVARRHHVASVQRLKRLTRRLAARGHLPQRRRLWRRERVWRRECGGHRGERQIAVARRRVMPRRTRRRAGGRPGSARAGRRWVKLPSLLLDALGAARLVVAEDVPEVRLSARRVVEGLARVAQADRSWRDRKKGGGVGGV
jgi:hypothetical protein